MSRDLEREEPKPEKSIEKYLVKGFKDRKGYCWKWVSPGRSGVPDRIGLLYPARIYFIEVKTKGGKLTPLQNLVWDILVRLGFSKWVVYSHKDVDKLFEEIDRESKRYRSR